METLIAQVCSDHEIATAPSEMLVQRLCGLTSSEARNLAVRGRRSLGMSLKWARWTPELCRECCRIHFLENQAVIEDLLLSSSKAVDDSSTDAESEDDDDQISAKQAILLLNSSSSSEEQYMARRTRVRGKSPFPVDITVPARQYYSKKQAAENGNALRNSGTKRWMVRRNRTESSSSSSSPLADVQTRFKEALVQRYTVESLAITHGIPVRYYQCHNSNNHNSIRNRVRKSQSPTVTGTTNSNKDNQRGASQSAIDLLKMRIGKDETFLQIIEEKNIFGYDDDDMFASTTKKNRPPISVCEDIEIMSEAVSSISNGVFSEANDADVVTNHAEQEDPATKVAKEVEDVVVAFIGDVDETAYMQRCSPSEQESTTEPEEVVVAYLGDIDEADYKSQVNETQRRSLAEEAAVVEDEEVVVFIGDVDETAYQTQTALTCQTPAPPQEKEVDTESEINNLPEVTSNNSNYNSGGLDLTSHGYADPNFQTISPSDIETYDNSAPNMIQEGSFGVYEHDDEDEGEDSDEFIWEEEEYYFEEEIIDFEPTCLSVIYEEEEEDMDDEEFEKVFGAPRICRSNSDTDKGWFKSDPMDLDETESLSDSESDFSYDEEIVVESQLLQV